MSLQSGKSKRTTHILLPPSIVPHCPGQCGYNVPALAPTRGAVQVHCTQTAWGATWETVWVQLTGDTPIKMGVVRFDLPDYLG